MATQLHLSTAAGPALVELVRPRNAAMLLVLTHGAAGGVDTAPDLQALRMLAPASGIAVALVTQPYRVAGRRTPPVLARQDETWLELLAALLARPALRRLPLSLGGRSNGARVACRTAAATGAHAVVALAFPLHPPGRPDRSRLDELQLPTVPVLVVQGSKDGFGMPEAAPGRCVIVVEGADHSLRKGASDSAAAVIDFLGRTSRVG